MNLEKLLNEIRNKYTFWVVGNGGLYYLLELPVLLIADKDDPQTKWDEEETCIHVAAYVPGKLMHDNVSITENTEEYKISMRVYYLDFKVEDEEIERLKNLNSEDLRYELPNREITDLTTVNWTPEKFKELFL